MLFKNSEALFQSLKSFFYHVDIHDMYNNSYAFDL